MNSIKVSDLEYVGSFGVDSGQVIMVDPCYLHNITKFEYGKTYGWLDGEYGTGDQNSYAEACETTSGEKQAGEMKTISAVVSSTGWGDGQYPVYVRRKHGRIVQIVIDFNGEVEPNE